MRKHFKAKKHHRLSFIFFLIIIIFIIMMDIVYVRKVDKDFLMHNDFKRIFNVDINPEKWLLFLSFNRYEMVTNNETIPTIKPVFNETPLKKPMIYLYNTHQTEEYKDSNIYEASKYMKDLLEAKGTLVTLEETDIASELKKNNLAYKDSYKITRELILKHMSDDMALYIDLHRDSSNYEASTIKIGDKSYAKIMFVIGGKHESFNENYNIAENLNKLLKNYNNKLSRGIFVRQSSSYNQDLSSNIILIEIGGPDNSFEEVKNSIDVLSEIIYQFLGE